MIILITGGNGLVASHLTASLSSKGHNVRLLSRSKFQHLSAEVFEWDINNDYIEEGALDDVEVVFHLAGAGIADEKWTEERKKVILDSRVESTKLLCRKLAEMNKKPRVFVGASAMGFYGYEDFSHWSKEGDPSGKGYLADITSAWEEAADPIKEMGIRLVHARIGMVLSDRGGALIKMAEPIRWLVGAPLGSGKQICNWIHVEDLVEMLIFFMNNEKIEGPYNAVASNPVTNAQLTKMIARSIRRPLWLPNVPAFVLKIILGEMAEIVLEGHHLSNQKVLDSGFQFKYDNAQKAVEDILAPD
ncbi:TIGR01777 family oxidoreductase [Reichenbachiella ulvae]|uniref:TIGR01777 family oxidoreductase n=1 Tax=Reichenbachiella ulvae TaxID=2980104 RepID=A0ABT3CYJ1_9BACT|nr:TIGR01777 family oxidoreductase [Reichenbachiella ulvae]MCV9388594.1 TIGR01777 family oxidoreductase [Reichenbachiella ulvae]